LGLRLGPRWEGREYDEVAEKDDVEKDAAEQEYWDEDEGTRDSVLKYLIDRKVAGDPGLLDVTIGELRGRPKKELAEN
jgi:hypothetical protein